MTAPVKMFLKPGSFVHILLLALQVLKSSCQIQYAAIGNPAVKYTGDGTFYGQQAGQNDQAECSFGAAKANSLHLPWSTGVYAFIAMNNFQWNNSEACGLCIMYRGLGDSPNCKSPVVGQQHCGLTPITSDWKMGLVDNRCSECHFGDIDQNLNGDGRWLVEWYTVPCNVGNSPFQYNIIGANDFYYRFVVSNTRVPIQSVEYYDAKKGAYVPYQRQSDNTWGYYQGAGDFPVKLRITSVLGDVVEDTLERNGNTGKAQFPSKSLSGKSESAPEELAPGPAPSGAVADYLATAGKAAPSLETITMLS